MTTDEILEHLATRPMAYIFVYCPSRGTPHTLELRRSEDTSLQIATQLADKAFGKLLCVENDNDFPSQIELREN